MDAALQEWRRLIKAEIRLRQKIHHQHSVIAAALETPTERAEMGDKLARANALLSQMKALLGEWE